jgi:signal peptidase I
MQTENKPATFWERHKEKKEKQKEKEKNKPLALKIWSWVWTILAAVLIAIAVRAFVAEPIRVDGTSMTNTLLDGEIVLVSKLAYRNSDNMKRNDIVICRYPGRVNENGARQINIGAALSLDTYTLFVKRLVALPGDTVQISGGHLYVNGEYVEDPEFMASVPYDYPLRTLGEDEYFVIGDNRRTSHDSRADDVGPISQDAIMGKVESVILPWGNRRTVK